ncbi:uncharacterized protein LOC116013239 [Ipomoea triloba]|uniref:uncharacterized protein LOC116013239 n=1 Tax=Ipomoea triloba TaxID=35885 RepID=UPI00125D8C2A|nr:uncharacterized protein LOC116013239 [Ipomoea triloba]
MDYENGCMGLGWVVRDHEGEVQGVPMRKVVGLYSVPEAEAMGAREPLSWIKRKGWEWVIIESDAQLVTRAVDGGELNTPFGVLVRDVRALLNQFESATFRFVRRGGNMVAHELARRSLRLGNTDLVEFFDYMPRFISAVVCKDFMN